MSKCGKCRYGVMTGANRLFCSVQNCLCEEVLYCEDYEPIVKPQTNADRIRAMSDEELAVQIALPYLVSPPWCAEHKTCPYISEDPTPCDRCALDWLKQEAEK